MMTRDTQTIPLPTSSSSSTPLVPDTTPHLNDIAAFQAALTGYKLSDEAKAVLKETPLVLLTSVTSAGRNTIMNELVKTGRYCYIPSDTTRPPRTNNGIWEQNGVEYFFRPEKEVLEDVQQGKYIGPAIIHKQQVSGINIGQVKKASIAHKIPITDIEIVGAVDILSVAPGTIAIFPLPPSFEEWLRRIRHRSHFTPQELAKRLTSAAKEIKAALKRPDIIFIINDRLYDTVAAVDGIARGAHQPSAEHRAHKLAEELHWQICKYLADRFNITV